MAMSWTTMEQNEGGGVNEERRVIVTGPLLRRWTGDPPSTADMLDDMSPKINDCTSGQ